MDRQDFVFQLNRIVVEWPKMLGPSRKELLWQIMKDLHVNKFAQIIDFLFEFQKVAPSIQNFKEARKFLSRKEITEIETPPFEVECETCFDCGLVVVTDGNQEVLANCTCLAEGLCDLPEYSEIVKYNFSPKKNWNLDLKPDVEALLSGTRKKREDSETKWKQRIKTSRAYWASFDLNEATHV